MDCSASALDAFSTTARNLSGSAVDETVPAASKPSESPILDAKDLQNVDEFDLVSTGLSATASFGTITWTGPPIIARMHLPHTTVGPPYAFDHD